ncbi:ERAD-associated protein [Coemansia aciculifera]|nr:ERAD-associated protein [Coemansia aciculifera]
MRFTFKCWALLVAIVAARATGGETDRASSMVSVVTAEVNEGGQHIEISKVVETDRVRRAEYDAALSVLQKYETRLHSRLMSQAERRSILKLRRNVWKLVPSAVRAHVRKVSGAVGGMLGLGGRGGGSGDKAAYQRPGVGQLSREVRQSIDTLYELAKAGIEDAVFVVAEMEMYGKYGTAVDVDSAFRHYLQLSELSGNATAQYMVGFFYATGLGSVEQRNGHSLLYTAMAALQGHVPAEATLAFRYASGVGAAMSCAEALGHYQAVARTAMRHYLSGPPLGRHMPGYRARLSDDRGGVYGVRTGPYSLHKAVDRASFDELLEYHQYNARSGNVKACLTLVDLYYHGHRFAAQDFGMARKYLADIMGRLFTRQGELRKGLAQAEASTAAQAAGMLGIMSWRGEGLAADTAAAFRWLSVGASMGHAASLNALGMMYQSGVQAAQDAERATELFKKAAEKQHQGGQVNYALAVMDKMPDVAMANFKAAAENGHILAHHYVAGFHATAMAGGGGEASCRMAVASYRFVAEKADWLHSPIPDAAAAAARGDVEAATLGYMRAAEMGYDVGQLNAALLLERAGAGAGALFPSAGDYEKQALVYWTRAANQNVADARTKQGDAYYYGRGTPRSYERAAAAYALAARTEASGLAMWSLGWMFEHGIGVTQDFHLAKRYYDQSLEANDAGRLAAHVSLARLCLRYLWAWASGRDVGEGPLFFAPRPVSHDEEERAAKPAAAAAAAANDLDHRWEQAAVEDNADDDANRDDDDVGDGGSLSESVFFIALLLGAAWMFLPLR